MELQPGNCAYRVRLAAALLEAGQQDKARQTLVAVDTLRPDGMPLSDREQLQLLRTRLDAGHPLRRSGCPGRPSPGSFGCPRGRRGLAWDCRPSGRFLDWGTSHRPPAAPPEPSGRSGTGIENL